MALLFADGFEHYGTLSTARSNMLAGAYAAAPSTTSVNSIQARTGSRSLENSQAGGARVLLNTDHNEVGVACGIFFAAMSTGTNRNGFVILDNASNHIAAIGVWPDGSIAVERGSILGQTDAGLIVASSWNHIEARILQDDVVGEVEIRVNGVVELMLTNLDLGSNKPRFFQTWGNQSVGAATRYIDDLILWDTTGDVNNDFFGPARVTTIWLDGDVSGNQWSVTGGATGAAAMTETAPDGDTSYVSAAVVNYVSEFSIEELPPEAEVIAGVYIPTMAKLAVAGVGSMQTSVVSGSDVETGADNPLTTAYTYRGDVFEKDPATGQQWSKGGLEAALIRIEKTA